MWSVAWVPGHPWNRLGLGFLVETYGGFLKYGYSRPLVFPLIINNFGYVYPCLPHFRKSAYIICIMGVKKKQQTCHNGVFTTDSLCPKAFAELKTWIWQEIDLHWIDFWMNFRWSFHYIQFFLCIMSANNQLLRFGQSSGLLSHPCESKYFERKVLASICLRFFFNLAAFCCQKNAIHV